MNFDLRLPIGILFSLFGLILTVYGVITRGSEIYQKSLGINMNINWGVIPLNEINERDKEKKIKMVQRAQRQLGHWLALFGEG